jgi:hypothetical protein
MAENLKYTVFGLMVWGLVWVMMRVLGASVFSEGNPWMIVFYLACFPLGIAFVYIVKAIFKLEMHELVRPMTIFTFVALMMDGFSFGFTKFYGVGAHELYSAAFLLWAPGVFVLCAFWVIGRAPKTIKNMTK